MAKQNKMTLTKLVKSNEFENWCHQSIIDVFENLFGVDVELNTVKFDHQADFEVSGVVAFMTDDIEAILQLSCSQTTIYNLSTSLTGDPIHDEKKILCIGEAVNIVFGMLKENMNFYDLHYEKCLPLVIVGQNHIILNLNKSEAFNSTYKSPFGLFNLKVGFNKKSRVAKAG